MRKLLYVPIIHMESDLGEMASAIDSQSASLCGKEMWAKHKETVAKFWESIAGYFATVDTSNLKIYQDGLPVDGELGRRIIEQGAKRGSKNHQIILSLMERGAEIRKTEDPSLLKDEYKNITGLVQSKSASEKAMAYVNYELQRDQLTKRRDKFVAKRIAETLKEGETGVLFMGSYHNISSYLPKDIIVEQLKERKRVNAYFKQLVSLGERKRLEQLAEYLASPCICPSSIALQVH
jgi:hypothetical protein